MSEPETANAAPSGLKVTTVPALPNKHRQAKEGITKSKDEAKADLAKILGVPLEYQGPSNEPIRDDSPRAARQPQIRLDPVSGRPIREPKAEALPAAPKESKALGAALQGATDANPAAEVTEDPEETIEGLDPEPQGAKPVADPELERRLAMLEKADRRQKEAIDKERSLMARERAQLERERQEFEAAKQGRTVSREDLKKLRNRPLELFEALGADEDYLATLSQVAYAHSKHGKNDPKAKVYAEQAAKEQSSYSELAETRERIASLEAKLEAKEKTETLARQVTEYLDGVIKEIPQTPTLIGKVMAKNPQKAKTYLHTAAALWSKQNDNETPTAAQVIAFYEKTRREELEDEGLDVASQLGSPVTAADTEVKRSKTLPGSGGNRTRPQTAALTMDEKRAAAIRDIEAQRKREAQGL